MERYTKEKGVIFVKTHYKYGESYSESVRIFRGIFGRRNPMNQSTVQRMIKKFEETGSIMDSKLPVRHHSRRSVDNIAAVRESVAESPGSSSRHRLQKLDITRSTMQRTLKKDLHLLDYKIQLTKELKSTDRVQRGEFVKCLLEGQMWAAIFLRKSSLAIICAFNLMCA
jgi:transposase